MELGGHSSVLAPGGIEELQCVLLPSGVMCELNGIVKAAKSLAFNMASVSVTAPVEVKEESLCRMNDATAAVALLQPEGVSLRWPWMDSPAIMTAD